MSRRVFLARFPDAPSLLRAAQAARASGFEVREAWLPSPVAGLDPVTKGPGVRLPICAGLVAGAVALAAQWLAARRDWPLALGDTVGGRLAEWIPIALLVGLVAAAAVAYARLVHAGRASPLPAPGFALALSTEQAGFDHRDAAHLLAGHGAQSLGYAELER